MACDTTPEDDFKIPLIEPMVAPGVTTPVVPLIVTGIILIFYTIVHVDPLGIVTITPESTVIGPADIAFLFVEIV